MPGLYDIYFLSPRIEVFALVEIQNVPLSQVLAMGFGEDDGCSGQFCG